MKRGQQTSNSFLFFGDIMISWKVDIKEYHAHYIIIEVIRKETEFDRCGRLRKKEVWKKEVRVNYD